MKHIVYIIAALLLVGCAWIVFRIFVRRDYRNRGKLTPLSALLELLIFSACFAFPYTYNPADWPWFWELGGDGAPALKVAGFAVIIAGMLLP